MATGKSDPKEIKERAVRLVSEAKAEDPGASMPQLFSRIGSRLGVSKDTLRTSWRQAQVDEGRLPGISTEEKKRIEELEAEVKEWAVLNFVDSVLAG
jgi:transposase-like protein